ncbi:MAG TPA: fumarylacetoacetate hydrolase family protein [Alphaproteobacteria bacterium]|nr:fumarylacetoacetate hydrolase family protein [Alphaproteobacteria bacterium]
MKLGSLNSGGRDGTLVVVSNDLSQAAEVPDIASTLQSALENWVIAAPELASIHRMVCEGNYANAFALDPSTLMAPLPRAYQFLDGSAYLNHVELVRKARKAEMPPSLYEDPLMYQAVSDGFLAPTQDIALASEDFGIDFEAEVVAVLDDVPMGVSRAAARDHIKLIMLVNDVSLRGLIPPELAKGFGFIVGKPRSAFSPVAVTPSALGAAWDGGKVNLPLRVAKNGEHFGAPNAGVDMNFDFPALIAHAAQTRPLAAGTIIGSGTVSNRDCSKGFCCIAEIRTIETIEEGAPKTPFMKFGDRVRIEMLDEAGASIFGAIEQTVVEYKGP